MAKEFLRAPSPPTNPHIICAVHLLASADAAAAPLDTPPLPPSPQGIPNPSTEQERQLSSQLLSALLGILRRGGGANDNAYVSAYLTTAVKLTDIVIQLVAVSGVRRRGPHLSCC